MLPEVEIHSKPNGTLRVVSCNINPQNNDWLACVLPLLDLEADVVILLELSPENSRSIERRGQLVDSRYSHRSFRDWKQGKVSAGAILSKWPLEELSVDETIGYTEYQHFSLVRHTEGEFVVGLLHPFSPRNQSRWSSGNRIVNTQAAVAASHRDMYDIPVLVGCDLNAGPAQIRSRLLRRHSLAMSKPLLRYGGSFPTQSRIPDPLRLQLDDVWSSDGLVPVAWSMVDAVGSDHKAVIVDFEFSSEMKSD